MQQPKNSRRGLNPSNAVALFAVLFGVGAAQAGYLVEIDTDAADDGVLTYNSHFGFGGDTSTASQSVAGAAYGLTGGDSIFGGNGVESVDTYVYTYDPGSDADNLVIPMGTDLGLGVAASGITGGNPGVYAVFATWPTSANVSGGLTTYTATTAGDSISISLDQLSAGDVWVKVGEITWTSGPITVTQEAAANTFVSMRAAGVLFEPVAIPEPSTFALGLLGALALGLRARKCRQ